MRTSNIQSSSVCVSIFLDRFLNEPVTLASIVEAFLAGNFSNNDGSHLSWTDMAVQSLHIVSLKREKKLSSNKQTLLSLVTFNLTFISVSFHHFFGKSIMKIKFGTEDEFCSWKRFVVGALYSRTASIVQSQQKIDFKKLLFHDYFE